MKNFLSAAALALMLPFAACAGKNAGAATVKVWGNCGMCKKTIEKAAKLPGVAKADWNVKSHMLQLSYDSKMTSPEKVEQSIARAGYDTEHFTADQKAYDNLHECCQYERK